MCGIVGYTGPRSALDILVPGLEKLEYRGYDSAGICVVDVTESIQTIKTTGKLSGLKEELKRHTSIKGYSGIGHTRWATHGEVTLENAHPHQDCAQEISVAHNGIVENYASLKDELQRVGHKFLSRTDTEIIPHLIEEELKHTKSLENAIAKTVSRLEGGNSILVISTLEKSRIIAARKGNSGSIAIGTGNNEMFVASDLPAIVPHTKTVQHLDAGEMAIISPEKVLYRDLTGKQLEKPYTEISSTLQSPRKGNFEHFMLKEIYEQPKAIRQTFQNRISFDKKQIDFPNFPMTQEEINSLKKIVLVGMGSSLHAAMVGKTWMERVAGIPAEWDHSSEFRYRESVFQEGTLVISLTQSGETADTLAAMLKAREHLASQVVLSNYPGTQAERIAERLLPIEAGPEIGVAATKTFTCSLTTLYLFSIFLGVKRGQLDLLKTSSLISSLSLLPELMTKYLSTDDQIREISNKYQGYPNFLFLGRGLNYPLAMEGALKLKEVSYIHAEGYPAGEMKHGPISLIDNSMPVVGIVPSDGLKDKMLSNLSESKARGARVLAIASESDSQIQNVADDVIRIPDAPSDLNPIVAALPLQLLAYHIAHIRGCDIDQPRNLAKSVTVE